MSAAAVKRYWDRVAQHGCIVCGRPAEIAHAHGGSLLTELGVVHAKGKKLAPYDWLVLPLCPQHHRVEHGGLDANVKSFEARYGLQLEWLDLMALTFGVDVWALAGVERRRVA